MKTIPVIILSSMLLTMSLTVSAVDIKVRVFDRGSKSPLGNAAVCLGTSARIDQFGAFKTDDEGFVSFSNVPQAPLLITVSRPSYMAEQQTLVTSASDRMLVMSLSNGGGGTPCPLADTASSEAGGGPGIYRFALDNGNSVTADRTVTLNNHTNSKVTQYRASERSDFSGASWQDYAPAPVFQLSPNAGRKVVYFQVRRYASAGSANIESLSPTVKDSIILQ
jgi:hypothetical protein